MRSRLAVRDHVGDSNQPNYPHQRTPPTQNLSKNEKRGYNNQNRRPLKGSAKLYPASPLVKAKIFMGGIPSTFTKADLLDYFESFGEVFAIKLKTKKKNVNVNLGFGTITVEKSTADRILATTFHYIKDREVECQRFVKNNKSRNQLIKDKKLRTLYISQPPESMNTENLKAFFEKFGKIENAYILPERRVPLPGRTKHIGNGKTRIRIKYDVLKKKALILFETSEEARTAYEKSRRGEVVFDGFVIKLAYKWPGEVERILTERKEHGEAKQGTLRRGYKGEGELGGYYRADTRPEDREHLKERLPSYAEDMCKKRITHSLREKESSKRTLKRENQSNNYKLKQRSSRKRPTAVNGGMLPIPVLKGNHSHGKAEISLKIQKKRLQQTQNKNEKKFQNFKTCKRIEINNTIKEHQELTQAQLLEDLPERLKRTKKDIRGSYYDLGFWGFLAQKLEERRRIYTPSQKQYNHTEQRMMHLEFNTRINFKISALRQSNLSLKNVSEIHHSQLNPSLGQLQRPEGPPGPDFTREAKLAKYGF